MDFSLKRIPRLLNIGLSLGFVIFSGYLFAYGNMEDDQFRAWMGTLCAGIMLLPTLIYYSTSWKHYITYDAMNMAEMMLDILLVLNGIGSLGFYRTLEYYDFILHIVNPLLGTWVIAILIGEYLQATRKYSLLRVQTSTLCTIIGFIIAWEAWEFFGDQLFGTEMFGQNGEWYIDTLSDIIAGVAGMTISLILSRKYLDSLLTWLNNRTL